MKKHGAAFGKARRNVRVQVASATREGTLVPALVTGSVLLALVALACWAPFQEVRGMALLVLVPAAALVVGGSAFALSQMRHREEIVIQRGPERP